MQRLLMEMNIYGAGDTVLILAKLKVGIENIQLLINSHQ